MIKMILWCNDKRGALGVTGLAKLSKFLVRLFNNPICNPRNAQLVVATHEVTLLDKEVFRKDQIWFAEKNKQGATE